MNPRKWLFATIQFIWITGIACCWAQAQTENPIWKPCPLIPTSDSTTFQKAFDSVANYLPGRWELVEIGGGWGPNQKPYRVLELVINQKREGTVYENGVETATFQLTLKMRLNTLWFRLDQQGKSIFKLPLKPNTWGLMSLCGEKLGLSDGRSHGYAYAFRRVASKD